MSRKRTSGRRCGHRSKSKRQDNLTVFIRFVLKLNLRHISPSLNSSRPTTKHRETSNVLTKCCLLNGSGSDINNFPKVDLITDRCHLVAAQTSILALSGCSLSLFVCPTAMEFEIFKCKCIIEDSPVIPFAEYYDRNTLDTPARIHKQRAAMWGTATACADPVLPLLVLPILARSPAF